METLSTEHSVRKILTTTSLLVGPMVCAFLAEIGEGGRYLPAGVFPYAMVAILLAWSPLPASIPAVVLGEARDRFEPGQRGIGRGLRLLKHLSSKGSAVQGEFFASLAGFAAAVLYAAL